MLTQIIVNNMGCDVAPGESIESRNDYYRAYGIVMTDLVGDRPEVRLSQKIQFLKPKVTLEMREERRQLYNFPEVFDTAHNQDAFGRLNERLGNLLPNHLIGNSYENNHDWIRATRYQFVEFQDPKKQHIPLRQLQELVCPRGIATVEQFKEVGATFKEWKAFLHLIGKTNRHDLGDIDRKPRTSVYVKNGFAAIETYCNRYQYELAYEDRAAYHEKR